jgi:hypothetical protein
MATTPNYGWVTPAPTDFVTDLPADFETFADAVDADLAGLLGGTTGQTLTKVSNADHDFTWQSAAASGTDWTLVNAGGTALTGAQTVTVSGITGADKLYIYIDSASSANSAAFIEIRLNADTGSNYQNVGNNITLASTYSASNFGNDNFTHTGLRVARLGNSAADQINGAALITGCNSTGIKIAQIVGGSVNSQQDSRSYTNFGYYTGNTAITSISIFSSTGNLDTGTVYVYKSA